MMMEKGLSPSSLQVDDGTVIVITKSRPGPCVNTILVIQTAGKFMDEWSAP